MKKVLSIILSFIIISSIAMTASLPYGATTTDVSETGASDSFEYDVMYDDTAKIILYKGTDSEVTIPSTIDGYVVSSIDWRIFDSCTNVNKVNIPDSVTSISVFTFSNCASIGVINVSKDNPEYSSVDGVLFNKDKTEIIAYPPAKTNTSYTIPNDVETIESYTFDNCTNLKEIILSDSVTEVRDYSFCRCKNLNSLTFSKGVKSIEDNFIESCESLNSINVAKDNTEYSSLDGVLFNKDKTLMIYYPKGKKTEHYTIPNGVTDIDDAISNCTTIKSISIPASVTNIRWQAFSYCINLERVILSEGLKSISESAFYNCTSLKGLDIPSSVTNISSTAFYNCTSFTEINVSKDNKNYSSIQGVMYDKDKTTILKYPVAKSGAYVIPNSVKSLAELSFYQCNGLTEVTIPDSVSDISPNAFRGCSALVAINVSDNNTAYCSLDGVLFSKDKTKLIKFPNAKSGVYTIPNFVTTIDTLSFYQSLNLTEVIIPEGVKEIAMYSFLDSPSIESVTFAKSVTNINSICGIGYDINDFGYYIKSDSFTVKGYPGTAAEEYAKQNGFNFVDLSATVDQPAIIVGDADGDGEVSILDATTIQRHLAKLNSTTFIEKASDTDNDGEVTILDATLIQRFLAHLIDKLG